MAFDPKESAEVIMTCFIWLPKRPAIVILISLALLSNAASVWAQSSAADGLSLNTENSVYAVGTTWRTTFESWRLSDDERMGMIGANLLFDVHPKVKLGIGSYGALTGKRGGFITLGGVAELEQSLSDAWSVRGGVFVGAGGGAGGYELAGGGFMFRADAGLTYRLGRYGNVGAGVSWVTFPTGSVRSVQPYLMYEYPFNAAVSDGWPGSARSDAGGGSSLGLANREEFSIGWTGYKIASSVTKSDGSAQSNSMQLAGARWTSYLDDRWFLMVQADGAFAGDSAGYMQILGGAGYRLPLGRLTGLKVYATLGPAGGGGVATGGGLIYAGGIALQQMITDQLALELGIGGVKAGSGDFKAWSVGVNLSYVFGVPRLNSSTRPAREQLAGFDLQPLRVRVMNQTYVKADDNWRSRDEGTSVNNLGFALDYFVSPTFYLTGQGLAAYSGQAGAYMTGLLGAGLHQPLSERWFVTAEALVGAAGGGTLATGNGSVWQINGGFGYRLTKGLDLTLTAGRMQAPTGNFKANVVGVNLGYRFGLPTRPVTGLSP